MNITDIAKLAGVSRATVSRYLNEGYVSEEKRKKIKDVIDETGYTPSLQAQILRTKKSRVIGVIAPKVSSGSIARIVDGICVELARNDYHVFLGNAADSMEREFDYLEIFKNNGVDGVIVVATSITQKHQQLIEKMTVPVVVIGQKCEVCSSVYHDDLAAAEAITAMMLKKRKKNLAYFGVSGAVHSVGTMRRQGFFEAVRKAGLNTEDIFVRTCDFSLHSGYETAKKMIEEGCRVEGIVCATDTIAAGAVYAFKEAGYDVPRDVSITGFGDSIMAALITPALTTVHYQYVSAGEEAAKMIISLSESGRKKIKSRELMYTIVNRGTL